jgi:hypothetical protein
MDTTLRRALRGTGVSGKSGSTGAMVVASSVDACPVVVIG